jgi:hypothetical protein
MPCYAFCQLFAKDNSKDELAMKPRSAPHYEEGGPELGQGGQLLGLALFWAASRILRGQPLSSAQLIYP